MSARLGCGALPFSGEAEPAGLALASGFRFRRLGERVLLTNDAGDHAFLSVPEFQAFLDGGLAPDAACRPALRDGGFLEGARPPEETVGPARAAQGVLRGRPVPARPRDHAPLQRGLRLLPREPRSG